MKTVLDKYQKNAIYSRDKNTMIIAAPGSGKTLVIINRVKYLIEKCSIHPKDIVVITFTRAAALNMKSRYINLSKSKFAPFFGTFHSFFYNIIKKHYGEINIINSNISYRIIKNVIANYMDEVSDDKVREALNNISFFKTSGIDIREFNPSIDKNIFSKCYEYYEGYKKENNLLDFDDLQILCLNLFKNNKQELDYYKRRFKYILVDEFQDCDYLQIEILKLLSSDYNSIFAVGDEDQSIYSFRGSRPDCMIRFEEYFEFSSKKFLEYNYRCAKNIVDISKNLIKHNRIRNKKDIKSAREAEGNIEIISSLNESEQASKIADILLEQNNKEGFGYNQNVILYRTNIESRSFIDAFIKKKIPFKFLDKKYNFFEHFICKDIIAYLKLSMDNTNKDSFVRIINKPFRYVSKINIEKIKRNPYKENCFELLKEIEEKTFQIRKIEEIETDIDNLKHLNLSKAVDFILYNLEYNDFIRQYSNKLKLNYEELSEVINEFKVSVEDFNNIEEFLKHVDEVTRKIESKTYNQNTNSVLLSTIHGVKGMEFKNVFIINCVEGNLPHINSMNDKKDMEEERRLFYVAITRAIENLWLCITQSVKGKFCKSSRFIGECGYLEIEKETGFKIGDKVLHKIHGQAEVINIEDDVIRLKFLNGIFRIFSLKILIEAGLISKIEK